MKGYFLNKMVELDADGVDFTPLTEVFMRRDYLNMDTICSYAKADLEFGIKYFLKTPYLFWKMVDGKKVYCS